MPAFTPRQMDALKDSLGRLHGRMQGMNHPPRLTHHEVINLCTPQADRELAFLIPKKFNTSSATDDIFIDWGEGGKVGFDIRRNYGPNDKDLVPLVPRNPKLQDDADPEVVYKITSWITEYTKQAKNFARAKALVIRLNEICDNPQQVRYVFPAIMGLLPLDERLEKLSAKLGDYRRPSNVPYVLQLKPTMDKVAETISTALLLDENLKVENSLYPVRISTNLKPTVVSEDGGLSFLF